MSDLFLKSFWLVPSSVLLAGIIGSPHCLSMCGPIVLNFSKTRIQLLAYQLGRMLAYVTAGAIVGRIGQVALGPSQPFWISEVTLITIAILLFVNGYRAFFNRPLHLPVPRFLSSFTLYLWKLTGLSSLPKTAAAMITGILTVFLPCGHLYGFLLGAVATGSMAKGAIFMFAFWLGSAPLLSVSGSWLQRIFRPKFEGGQRWSGALLIAAGLFSLLVFSYRTTHVLNPSCPTHLSHQSKLR